MAHIPHAELLLVLGYYSPQLPMHSNIDPVRVAGTVERLVARDVTGGSIGTATHVVKGSIGANLLHGRDRGTLVIVGGIELVQARNLQGQVNVRAVVKTLEDGGSWRVRDTGQGALEWSFDRINVSPVVQTPIQSRGLRGDDTFPSRRTITLASSMNDSAMP
jgi:hypothetical protein